MDSHVALRYLQAPSRIYTGIELFNIKTKTLDVNDPGIIHIMVTSVFRCSDTIFYPSSGLLWPPFNLVYLGFYNRSPFLPIELRGFSPSLNTSQIRSHSSQKSLLRVHI